MFGNKDEKNAQDEAAKAQADRLAGLPLPDLAAELMPAFGPGGPKAVGGGNSINMLQVANWLLTDYPRGTKYVSQLTTPVREGLALLEHAGLLERWGPSPVTGKLSATRLGETALADGSVRQHLGDA
jgi:hypothetical protein